VAFFAFSELAQFLTHPVRKDGSFKTSRVTVGFAAPGVHFGSGTGNPRFVRVVHPWLVSASRNGFETVGFTVAIGQVSHVTRSWAAV
jgi:hypothetical protein